MKKLNNRKGFTLMEMLIVVAIIAILVIIAIPTFNASLAKARAATDVANIRSGYAAAQVEAMTNGLKDTTGNAAANTYYLQKDGSVSNTTTDNYTCQGNSKNVAEGTTIGGAVKVNDAAGISWAKGDTITYTVSEDTNGVVSVTIGKGTN